MAFYAEDDEEEQVTGRRDGQDAMLQTQVDEDFTNPEMRWQPQNIGDSSQPGTRTWQELARQQQSQADDEQMKLAQQGFDANEALSQRLANDRKMQQLQRIRTGAYIQSATARDGMFDPDMIPEMQRQLGDPTFAGAYMRNRGQANEEYVMLSDTGHTTKDLTPQLFAEFKVNNGMFTDKKTGNTYQLTDDGKVCLAQVVPAEQRLRLYQDAGLGDRTLQDQVRLYNRMLKTSTPETLASMGINNPDTGVRVVGQTTDGKATSRLFGIHGPTRGNIHSFSADGRGNFSGSDYDWQTGTTTPRADLMMQSADVRKPWRMLSSGNTKRGNDGKDEVVTKARWENKLTGEVMELDPGENPDQKLRDDNKKTTGGLTFDQRKALKGMDIDARDNRQDKWIEAKLRESEDEKKNRKVVYNPKLMEAIQADIDAFKYETMEDGSPDYTRPRKLTDKEKKTLEQMEYQARAYRWQSVNSAIGNPIPADNEDPEPTGSDDPHGETGNDGQSVVKDIDDQINMNNSRLEELKKAREERRKKRILDEAQRSGRVSGV